MDNKILDIKYLQDLYFDQSKILFDHQISSFHQFIDEIIYNELKNEDNIFYENVDTKSGIIYKYGFEFPMELTLISGDDEKESMEVGIIKYDSETGYMDVVK